MTDQDHLRDDPELPLGVGARHPLDRSEYDEEAVEDRRPSKILRPLFQDATDLWASEQW